MKKKRLVSLLTAAAMMGSLTACGGGGDSGNTTAAPAGEESKAATEAETVAASEGQTVMKWSIWDKDLTLYYQPLIEEFEKQNPDLKIEMVDLGSSDYQTVLGTQLTGSGSDFDIVTIKDVPGYTTLVNKGVLEPLDAFISADGVDLSAYK